MTNRLAGARSAYLQSAAHQPIHWHPWEPEAFARAAAADRPVLLDIGAVWCHWCHVMDGESYEDPALAEFLNEHFVCIKVDRDERPDVDARYQRAVQAIVGQGGWPLTAFLLPDGQVFYGGTYFPPDGKYGRPGFRAVLAQVLHVYQTQRDRVLQQADALRRVLAEHLDEAAPGAPSVALLAEGEAAMARLFDPQHGGFGAQPKFPHPVAVRFLLNRWRDTGAAAPRDLAEHTLVAMQLGGIHDHLAGGFHRYAVDARWVVPHFEKMSYDNAELLRAYVEGHLALGHPGFAAAARGIIRWVREVLADPEGGYGASQDADVGLHDDGDYFTWTLEEARAAIGDDDLLAVAAAWYDIGTAGEMHHNPSKNVLHVTEPLTGIAARLGLDGPEAARRLHAAEDRLRAARARRPAPFVDRGRYTGWNGMLAGALLVAGAALAEPWAVEHALRTLRRLRAEQADPAALRHAPGGVGGLLDDQVQVALAALEAFEVTGEAEWIDWSGAIMERVWRDYRDPLGGGLYDTAERDGPGLLPTRATPVQDAPTPSPNGVAALCLARLHAHTQAPEWAERRDALLGAFAGAAPALGIYGATLLLALDWAVQPAAHLVIVAGEGPEAEALADAMHRAALATWVPRRVVRRVRPRGLDPAATPPALRAMLAAGGGTRGYACVGATCQRPATDLAGWRAALAAIGGPAGGD
ncbi:MAG: thioredoxin domain-containing protein [Gemmatimonadetes bacterium]|nr:thioredoxin domain-containing protein [Gemmatimonadota bacterium]